MCSTVVAAKIVATTTLVDVYAIGRDNYALVKDWITSCVYVPISFKTVDRNCQNNENIFKGLKNIFEHFGSEII